MQNESESNAKTDEEKTKQKTKVLLPMTIHRSLYEPSAKGKVQYNEPMSDKAPRRLICHYNTPENLNK